MPRSLTASAVVRLSICVASVVFVSAAPDRSKVAEIRYTEYGIPHIRAADYAGLGFGIGYAQARDNLCKIELGMLGFSGELSRHFGPDAAGNSLTGTSNSLSSDLYYRGVNASGVIERLVAQPAPLGPRDEVRRLVRGYVAGFNELFAEAPELECTGAAWLRPMTELDVYRRAYAVSMFSGQGIYGAAAIVSAEPPAMSSAPMGMNASQIDSVVAQARGRARSNGSGSNAVGIGRDASSTGGGLNVANPHLSWAMDIRWWQAQLTVPGQLDVTGATMLGVPLIVMGHTASAAWSITTAEKAARFTLFELQIVPGSPTEYLVDGVAEAMQRRPVNVEVKRADGSLETITRDQWWTRYGPVMGPGLIELPAWSAGAGDEPGHAYVLRDANGTNMRMLNTLFAFNHADDVGELIEAIRETQGVPWWTVVGADASGQALFSQLHVVPNVDDARAERCNTEIGTALFAAMGWAVLDGSRSECDWGTDVDALEPGIFGPGDLAAPRMPLALSSTYLENSNDSYWLPNGTAPLSGWPRIFGLEGSTRSLRTRDALTEITDQLASGPFTRQAMQDLVLSNRSYAAELAIEDTVTACRNVAMDVVENTAGEPIDLRAACEVLARWDRRMNIESRGALLFDRYWRALTSVASDDELLWKVGFDVAAPVTTPNSLAVDGPLVTRALADAVFELTAADIALDAALGEYQYIERGGKRIPLGGGGGPDGVLAVFNILNAPFDPERGYTKDFDGSGYIHVVQFDGDACPDAVSLLTYSQSDEPSSPHHADQTQLYSEKRWVEERFCEADIAASPNLEVLWVGPS